MHTKPDESLYIKCQENEQKLDEGHFSQLLQYHRLKFSHKYLIQKT